MLESAVAPQNAKSPILATLAGMVIDVSADVPD